MEILKFLAGACLIGEEVAVLSAAAARISSMSILNTLSQREQWKLGAWWRSMTSRLMQNLVLHEGHSMIVLPVWSMPCCAAIAIISSLSAILKHYLVCIG